MVVQRFTTEGYPLGQRLSIWREALGQIGLDAAQTSSAFAGRLDVYKPAAGLGGALIVAGPQTLVPAPPHANGYGWLGLLLEGSAVLADGSAIGGQDVLVWKPSGTALLAPTGRFRLLMLRRPQDELDGDAALSAALPMRLGAQPVLTSLLGTFAQAIEASQTSALAALDAALAEIMRETLGAVHGTVPQQARLRRRILRGIEQRLDDPDLNLARFAAAEAVSERAVKKLLESQGESFSRYLRDRRLERAARALSDPALQTVPVAEITFRCGFGEPAHFSRAFRQRFGMAPNLYRTRAMTNGAAPPLGTRSRGHPQPGVPAAPAAQPPTRQPVAASTDTPAHHHLRATPQSVHWGFFSNAIPPALVVRSGDTVTVETLTQHASDDPARMIEGDADAEAVFRWTATEKAIDRRGAGPMNASIYGRGAGEGFGVHILTGPIMVEGAAPGDVLEVEILDLTPRPSHSPAFAGRCFASNAAAWWGRHYDELLTGQRPREVITIYEIIAGDDGAYARAVHNFRWTPQRDPYGVLHKTIDYPGVPVDPNSINPLSDVLCDVKVPLRLHFGTIALAPDHPGPLDSVPPSGFGGNIDNWRLGVDGKLYLPVAVAGAMLSIGDPHAAQGDGEIGGTALECSLTGTIKVRLHKRANASAMLRDLDYPLIETATSWIMQGFSFADYLTDLGAAAQSEIYRQSSLDAAMRDAFRKARRFLMTARGLSEDEAISLLSVAVDFGVTQVVDGNWGVHAIIPKALFKAK
jgi:acetamidase/formamidase/AraC-like DNA-binding protein